MSMSCRHSSLHTMKRDIDICADVYAHVVLSCGTTILLLTSNASIMRSVVRPSACGVHVALSFYSQGCVRHCRVVMRHECVPETVSARQKKLMAFAPSAMKIEVTRQHRAHCCANTLPLCGSAVPAPASVASDVRKRHIYCRCVLRVGGEPRKTAGPTL